MASAQIRWTWQDNSDNETGFRLCDESGTVIIDNITAEATEVTEDISAFGTYQRKVQAFNADGDSGFSNIAEIIFQFEAPVSFAGVRMGDYIRWTWLYNGLPIHTGFRICDENDNVILDNIASESTTAWERISSTGSYTRKIQAFNATEASPFSDTSTVVVGIYAPSNLKGEAYGKNQIKWTWNDNATDEVGFRLYDEYGTLKVDNIPANTTQYIETVPGYGTYQRKVVAFNDLGQSSASLVAQVMLTNLVPFIGLKNYSGPNENGKYSVSFEIIDSGDDDISIISIRHNGTEVFYSDYNFTSSMQPVTISAELDSLNDGDTIVVTAIDSGSGEGTKTINVAPDINGNIPYTVIYTTPELLPAIPQQVMVSAEGTHISSSNFYISRDNGVNFTPAVINEFVDILSQPSGTMVVLKCELTGDLTSVGFTYQ